MMNVKKWPHSPIFMVILGSLFASTSSGHSLSPSPLPTDMVFAGGFWEETRQLQLDALALVDAKTLEITEIYRDTEHLVYLKPVSWSPQGDRLAFLNIQRGTGHAEICTLAMSNSLKTCYGDPMIYSPDDVNYNVTWSDDGQKIYFITQDQTSTTSY